MRKACVGRGGSVGVAGIGVSTTTLVGVVVGIEGLFVLVGLGIAVGTSPTGLRIFFAYVFATSKRHARRLLIAGIWYSKAASTNKLAILIKIFLLVMLRSVPELDEWKLIQLCSCLLLRRLNPAGASRLIQHTHTLLFARIFSILCNAYIRPLTVARFG